MANVKVVKAEEPEETCFIISPIGKDGSLERKRSDDVFTHVLEPAAKASGYKAIRADKISTPGIITNQVIHNLLEAPLVIADLTDHNANVYYELAIRHAVRKPLVEIIKRGQPIPFDVAATRVLQLDDPDLNNVGALTDQVKTAITAALSKSSETDNPITVAIDIHALGRSGKPLDAQLAAIIEMLADIRTQLTTLQQQDPTSSLFKTLDTLEKSATPNLGALRRVYPYSGISFGDLALAALENLEAERRAARHSDAPEKPKS